MNKINLFVPGRLCLLGEHSDWVSTYRKENKEIPCGYAIITLTKEGIYAEVKKSDYLELENPTIAGVENLNIEMDRTKLKKELQKKNFYSFVVGTALYLKEKYPQISGLNIKITKMDLPIKKGLASSAAICVLIAKAFNYYYNLNLTKEEEMNIAYEGERITSSLCGRLDQLCGYDHYKCMKVKFDNEKLEVTPIDINKDIHIIVVDLMRSKNTTIILNDLNNCYPFALTESQKRMHEAFFDNERFVREAQKSIEHGDIEELGEIMKKYQENFDEKIMPICKELIAPKLHSILKDEYIQKLTYGGKSIGSGGDGSVQFITKGIKESTELKKYLIEKKNLDVFEVILSNEKNGSKK